MSIGPGGFQFEVMPWEALPGHRCICQVVVYSLSPELPPRRHTLLNLVSFGLDSTRLLENPDFHCSTAAWLAEFWLPTLDNEFGGAFANILNGGSRVPGPEGDEKWSYITSRALAGFSFAFQLTGEVRYLQAADHMMAFLEKSADEVQGYLVFRSRQLRDGTSHPDADPLLNIFVHEYALTGALRYLVATTDGQAHRFTRHALESLTLFHDPDQGGFFDALERATLQPIPGVTSTKSFTSSADLLAAAIIFANEAGWSTAHIDPRAVSSELCEILIRHHLVQQKPFIIESLNANWTPNSSPWRNDYATADIAGNIGATAKVARVLATCLPQLPPALREEARSWVRDILHGLLDIGAWDPLRGGVYDGMLRNCPPHQPGEFVFHGDFVWWTQEQLCLASYLGFLLFGDRHYLEVARAILRFWICCFMAPDGGVYDTVDHMGNPVSTRMGRWVKSSYHEIEFAYFIAAFEAIINDRPLTLHFAPQYQGSYASALPQIETVRWNVGSKRTLPGGVVAITFNAIFTVGGDT